MPSGVIRHLHRSTPLERLSGLPEDLSLSNCLPDFLICCASAARAPSSLRTLFTSRLITLSAARASFSTHRATFCRTASAACAIGLSTSLESALRQFCGSKRQRIVSAISMMLPTALSRRSSSPLIVRSSLSMVERCASPRDPDPKASRPSRSSGLGTRTARRDHQRTPSTRADRP